MPVVVHRQVLVFWGPDVQKTAETPKLQFLDVVVDMPVGVSTGLQLVDKVLARRLMSCGVDFLWALCTGTCLGAVSSTIRCIRWRLWIDISTTTTVHAIKKAWLSLVKGFSSPRVPASVSSSTLAAQLEDAPVPDSIEWVELFDDIKSKTYYWKRRTRLSSWLPPVSIKVGWVGTHDEEGVFYYWHRLTRASTYDLPPLPPR